MIVSDICSTKSGVTGISAVGIKDSKVEIYELLIGGPEKDKRDRSKGERKLVVIAVER